MNSSYGVIECSGPDALAFLQGQLSCDMKAITPTHSGMGAYCNLKGRVIALFYISLIDGNYYLVLPRDMISVLLDKLKKFIVFSKATLKDVSDEWFVFTCKDVQIVITKNSNQIIENELSDHEWRKQLILNHIPYIGLEESEKFLPHYINLIDLKAVSFTKGCFVGQEVIARMEYRGNLKKECKSVVLTGDVPSDVGEVVNRIDDGGKVYLLVVTLSQ